MCLELNANHALYRFVILFFNCMLTFGPYFCFDMPSVLQSQFQGNYTEVCPPEEPNCCKDCLSMRADDYNLLYAAYAWTNAIVVIGAGFLVDKLGNRLGILLFTSFCVLGSTTFAAGTSLRGTQFMLPVMLAGRILFGAGVGSLTVAQDRITSIWFRNHELASAYGITLAFARAGSVLNFLSTSYIYDAIGLTWTLYIGAFLSLMGLLSAIVLSILDVYGMRQLGRESSVQYESRRMNFSDIATFPYTYWLLALSIMFFYNSLLPFVADASKFLQDKYNYSDNVAPYISGSVYDVSMVLSPFFGVVIDKVGKRIIMAFICALFTIPMFAILGFTQYPPLVATIFIGIFYSLFAACLWSSITLVIPQANLGTANGLATSFQMLGIGLSNLVVGSILGKGENYPKNEILNRWRFVMVFHMLNACACFVCTMVLNFCNVYEGGILNLSQNEICERAQVGQVDGPVSASESGSYEHSDPSAVSNSEINQSDQEWLISRANRVNC